MKNYRLPKTIKAYQDAYKLNYNTLLSENPKTIKSDINGPEIKAIGNKIIK